MTLNVFLELVQNNPFLLYYYAFSLIMSILLGRFFLIRMGHPRLWNYFFALLIYIMSVIGIFSLILFLFQIFTASYNITPFEMLIPFLTMVLALFLIHRRVNIALLTGFGNTWMFFASLFVILLFVFLMDFLKWYSFSQWPVSLFLLFLLLITFIVQRTAVVHKLC